MGQQRKRQERSRATYYQEEEVARLIVNLAQWSGDGASVRGCAGIWGRIVREFFRSSMPVVTVGVDAGRAKLALSRLPSELAEALFTFHVSSLSIQLQAKTLLGISRDTYHRRLVEAHPRFMEEYGEEGRNQVRQSNERAAHVRGPDFIETPPASRGPRRLVKRGAKNV